MSLWMFVLARLNNFLRIVRIFLHFHPLFVRSMTVTVRVVGVDHNRTIRSFRYGVGFKDSP